MSSDNLIRQNYSSYSTNPNTKYKPEELDKWANSSENYNSFINGEQVEDFQLFDYNSLGDSRDERISGYKQEINQFAQDYINQYDIDGNNSLDIEEFTNMQAQAYKETFGEELDTNIVAENLQQQFNSLNSLDQDSSAISSKEFAAFLGVADSQDGLNDGIISYSNFNTVPQQNGYETALKNHYKDFFNN